MPIASLGAPAISSIVFISAANSLLTWKAAGLGGSISTAPSSCNCITASGPHVNGSTSPLSTIGGCIVKSSASAFKFSR